jgi:hypothetical protein
MSFNEDDGFVNDYDRTGHIVHDLLHFLKLTWTEIVSFVLEGLLILITSGLVVAFEKNGFQDTVDTMFKFWSDIDYLYDLNSIWNNVSAVAFWALIGAVLYILIWSLVVIIVDSYNNLLISTRFVHPDSFHQSSYWAAIMARSLMRVVGAGVLLVVFMWLLTDGLGQLFSHSYAAFSNGLSLDNLSVLANIPLQFFAAMYLMTIALRVLLMRSRVY